MSEKGIKSRFFNFFRAKEPILLNLDEDLILIMRHLEFYAYDKLLGDNGLGNRIRDFINSPKSLEEIRNHMNWNRGTSDYNKKFIRRYIDFLGPNVIKITKVGKGEDLFQYKGAINPLDEKIVDRLKKTNNSFLLAGEDLIDLGIDSIFANQALGQFNELSVAAIWDSLFADNYLMQFRVSAFDEGLGKIIDKPEWNILDIGSGNGWNTSHILQNAINLGIDVNLTVVEYSAVLMYRTRAVVQRFLDEHQEEMEMMGVTIQVNYIQEDILNEDIWFNINLKSKKLDMVFLINMIQNFSKEQLNFLFQKISTQALNDKGYVVIANFVKGDKHSIFDILFNVTENYQGLPTFYDIVSLLRTYFAEIETSEESYCSVASKIK